jgi:hypothetical protein
MAAEPTEVTAPTTYEAEIERQRKWLREHKDEYLLAKSRTADASERVERLAAFEEARKLCLDAPQPKDGNEALYRWGYLRRLFEQATRAERTVRRYEDTRDGLVELEAAAKRASGQNKRWFLPNP